MRQSLLALAISAALLAACSDSTPPAAPAPTTKPMADTSAQPATAAPAPANPLLGEWQTAHGAIPFDQIKLEHLAPALDAAIAEQRAAVSRIAADPAPASFVNTLEALERAGASLRRVTSVYGVYTSNLSSDEVRKLETEYNAKLSALATETLLNPQLFARVRAVYESAETQTLGAEAARLAEQTYQRFVQAGAALTDEQRTQVAELTQRESQLQTRFNQNLLRDTDAYKLVLEESDLDGLPPSERASAGQAATDAGMPGKYVYTLQRPSYEGFMTYATRRDLREQLYNAFTSRGDNGNDSDNNAVVAEIVKVRAERARLLGFDSHAAVVTAQSMAKTPAAALELLERVWQPALVQTRADAEALTALIKAEGADHALEGWDWRYYAEKLRQQRFALDPVEVAPYFGLDNMLNASFAVTQRLFGLSFRETKDVPVYHPDVRVFEVRDAEGNHRGLFYIDYFARSGKRSGAWMANYRPQQKLNGDIKAHVVNNLNVPKPPPGQPALVSLSEATTLFHELGHALHGLLSDVKYPSLSGTAVPRDYVEFPAQFLEHYVLQPAILKEFAKHVETGEPIPDELIAKLLKAETFNQGFATVEFVASALVDQRFHALTPDQAANIDPDAFERQVMTEIGALPQIPMRHRTPHFAHSFGGGYAAAYYAYMWSEVLDSDGFAAFEESGDIFDPATAARLKEHVYSAGNTVDWMTGYVAFRGREPAVEPLLRNRGLLNPSP